MLIGLSGFGDDGADTSQNLTPEAQAAAQSVGEGVWALVLAPIIGSVLFAITGAVMWREQRALGGVLGFFGGGALGGVIGVAVARYKVKAAADAILPSLQASMAASNPGLVLTADDAANYVLASTEADPNSDLTVVTPHGTMTTRPLQLPSSLAKIGSLIAATTKAPVTAGKSAISITAPVRTTLPWYGKAPSVPQTPGMTASSSAVHTILPTMPLLSAAKLPTMTATKMPLLSTTAKSPLTFNCPAGYINTGSGCTKPDVGQMGQQQVAVPSSPMPASAASSGASVSSGVNIGGSITGSIGSRMGF